MYRPPKKNSPDDAAARIRATRRLGTDVQVYNRSKTTSGFGYGAILRSKR